MGKKSKSASPHELKIEGVTYRYNRPLKGRGQSGLAGFYNIEGQPENYYLIKQDNPATCLAESLAILYTPPGMDNSSSLIQANAGTLKVNNKNTVV